MVKIVVALLLLATGSSCALETRSLTPRGLGGNGGVAGNGGDGASGGAGGQGGQVEPTCLPGTERSACDGKSCHPETLVCTSMALESRGPCDTCYADSNCAEPNHRCVKMTYDGSRYPDDTMGFCLQLTEAEGADCAPPFTAVLHDRESVSGPPLQSYCAIKEARTTCDAVGAFHAGAVCPTGRDDECLPGGICRPIATQGNQTQFRCTYACVDAPECSTQSDTIDCAGYCGG